MPNNIEFKILGDVKDIEKKLGSVGKSFNKLGKQITTYVSLPLALIGGSFIKAASDAEETQSKFNVVFKDIAKQANKWAIDFGKSVGRSTDEVKRFSSGLGDVLKPLGFTTEEAFKMSSQMTQLALDVASFNNRQDSDVIRAFTSALTGERESLKTLGIVISEADVKQEAFRLGLVRQGEEISKTAKAQATLSLLYKNTEDAQGDLIRTQDSFANQLKRFQAELNNLSVSFGKILLPAATKLVSSLASLLTKITELDTGTKTLVLGLVGFAAAIGPVLLIIGGVASGIGGIASFAVFASNKVFILGNAIFSLAGVLKVIAGVGAAAFIGWNLGRTISEILKLDEGLQAVFEKVLSIRRLNQEASFAGTQATRLAASGITQADVNAFARRNAEKQAQLDQEASQQEEHEQRIQEIKQGTFDFVRENERLLEQEQEAKKALSLVKEQEDLQKFISELENKRSILEEHGQLTIEIENSIQDAIQKAKEKGAANEKKIFQNRLSALATFSEQTVGILRQAGAQTKEIEFINAVIQQSGAIMKAWNSAPFPYNLPAVALTTAQTGIVLSTIAKQSYAVGTPSIPQDMVANVHKEEMIIPATFSSAIRRGDLTLSGPDDGGGGSATHIVLSFDGAQFVGVSEEMVEEIFTKASEQIENGTLAFRGAA
ncbi:MAG: phage tail tape measure protein [Candidatus Omnitrophica bacterium]|nr:phage tail tape measure protein [Candidatus Omnitrophota bacterium]